MITEGTAVDAGVCANCSTAVADRYCPHCGQRHRGRLRARQLFGEALDQVLSLESRLWRTAIELMRGPGQVARAYVAGRRSRFVNPFKYCLAMVAAYLLFGAALGVDPSERIRVSLDQGGTPPTWAGEAQTFVRGNLNNVIFLALPLFAAGLRLLYRRAGFNYAETYAFVLFVVGQVFLVGLLLTPLAIWLPTAMVALRLAFHFIFFAWAAMVFYDQRSVGGALRASAANALYILSIFPVAMAFLVFYAFVLRG